MVAPGPFAKAVLGRSVAVDRDVVVPAGHGQHHVSVFCVDLVISASGADGVTLWTASRIFNAGDVVSYQGNTFRALWYTRNQVPGDQTGPWSQIAAPPPGGGPAAWTPSTVYNTGDRVSYSSHVYEAKWWTRNQVPGDAKGPWKLIS